MAHRVVVWGTGNVGRPAIRAILASRELELAGVIVHAAEKVGVDAGVLAGVDPVGVLATDDIEAVLATHPDAIAYCASGDFRPDAALDDIERCLRAGVDVVTPVIYALLHPPSAPAPLRERFEAACAEGDASLFVSGIDPGWALDLLPLVLSGVAGRIDEIRAQEIFCYETYDAPDAVRFLIGFGQPLDTVPPMLDPDVLVGIWGGMVRVVADGMGLTIDEITTHVERFALEHDVDVPGMGRFDAGTQGAFRFEVRGMIGGEARIVMEHVTRIVPDTSPELPRCAERSARLPSGDRQRPAEDPGDDRGRRRHRQPGRRRQRHRRRSHGPRHPRGPCPTGRDRAPAVASPRRRRWSAMSAVPLLSVAHCNVNCTDLTRSRAFYQRVLGLQVSTHTNPDPQDGSGFGIDGPAAWDAYMLHDHRGAFSAPVVDLLQWLVPDPIGSPYAEPDHVGLANLRFAVPALGPVRAALGPAAIELDEGDRLLARDPDGVRLLIGETDTASTEYRGVTVNCSDLGYSTEWYHRVLDLAEVADGAVGTFPGSSAATHHLALPGRESMFTITLAERSRPAPEERAYAEANHVGIFRMAFLVTDIDEGYERLRAEGVECFSPPVTLDMGPEVPIDGLRALFFPDPDGACLELIESVRA